MEENKIKIATYNSLIRNVSVQGGRMQYNSQNNKSKMRINLLDNSSNRRHYLESLLQFVNVVSRNKKNLWEVKMLLILLANSTALKFALIRAKYLIREL